MLYEKRVRYLDHYEGGVRVGSSGFAKIEVRDSSFRMDLTVKGLHPTDSFIREVLLCGAGKEAALGTIRIQGGTGTFQHTCHMYDQIDKTGISYEEWSGIRIFLGGSREISCRWKPLNPAFHGSLQNAGQRKKPQEAALARKVNQEKEAASAREVNTEQGMTPAREMNTEQGMTPAREVNTEQGMTPAREVNTKQGMIPAREVNAEQGMIPAREVSTRQRMDSAKKALSKKEIVAEETGGLAEENPGGEKKEPGVRRMPPADTNAERGAELMRVRNPEEGKAMTEESGAEKGEETLVRRKDLEEEAEQEGKKALARRAPAGEMALDKKASLKERVTSEGEIVSAAGRRRSSGRFVNLQEDKWKQLSSIYPHIQPFQDERDYLSIGPADFVLFPAQCYKAVNNSFLLHGYYNYHHLLLARMEKRGETIYYVGVPGNYYEKEKQVAVMFGFESFECAQEPAQVGDFGYYMMRVEI